MALAHVPRNGGGGIMDNAIGSRAVAIELMESAQGKSSKVLSQKVARQMVMKEAGSYGLGVSVGDAQGTKKFSHGGSNEGFTCVLVAYVETGQGAIVMTNSDNGPPLFNEILRAISQEYNWKDNRPRERTTAAKLIPHARIVFRAIRCGWHASHDKLAIRAALHPGVTAGTRSPETVSFRGRSILPPGIRQP